MASRKDAAAAAPAGEAEAGTPPVVGVGSSAGGLEALSQLLRALSPDTGLAFVLVQHLASTRESLLVEILSRVTAMPVTEAQDRTAVAPNHVYVIPPGRDMSIAGGVLSVFQRDESHGQHRPIDHFFRSLAADQGHRAIGVILSGTASDGTHGLEAVKEAGGITFAQDASAQQHGMPQSAIAAGCVDLVLAPGAIAQEIARIAVHARAVPAAQPASESTGTDEGLTAVLSTLRVVTGVDFTRYRAQTLQRRITRRMMLHKLDGLAAYGQFLQTSAAEVEALYQDILISVTAFFRDPAMFARLKSHVIPALAARRAPDETIRVWVVGCSSGEEAYSIAIAFCEHFDSTGTDVPVQIFATDLSDAGIEKARNATYSRNMTQDISPERLRRFFTEADGRYRIIQPVRSLCVFSRHNVLSEPPFSHIDLLSCRNLLIYMEPVLQERLLALLQYALNPRGFLVLGSSESLGAQRSLFAVEDADQKLYSKRVVDGEAGAAGGRHAALPAVMLPALAKPSGPRPAPQEGREESALQSAVDRILLAKLAPAAVVVDAGLEIVSFRGDTSPFLAPAAGRASFQLVRMAREGLAPALRALLQHVQATRAPARQDGVRLGVDGAARDVNLEVVPLPGSVPAQDRFLVLFVPAPDAGAGGAPSEQAGSLKSFLRTAFAGKRAPGTTAAGSSAAGDAPEARAGRLAAELSAARLHLQSVIEQQDIVNEKLSTANTRAQAANEELQSINEELATSQEEIQASNEELATVNDELNDRNLDVSKINNDLVNLIGGVQLPIVMLGKDLRIRRYSPMAEKVLNLLPADIGRPIADAKLSLPVPELDRLVADVLRTGTASECEVQDGKGRWYALRIRPYRTTEGVTDGVVLILVDVDTSKRAREFAESVVATLREPLLVLDGEFRVRMASRAYYEGFRTTPAETEHLLLHELARGQWDIPELRRLLEVVLPQSSFFDGFEVERDFPRIGRRTLLLNARQLRLGVDEPPMILLAIEDYTRHKQLEDDLQLRLDDLATVDRSRTEFLSMLAHELRNPLAAIGSGLTILSTPAAQPDVLQHARDLAGRQLRALVRLTDDLLDVSRVTRGRIQLQREPLDLVELLRQALELSGHEFDARRQALVLDLPEEPIPVVGDAIRLKQVFVNLLQNASKYGCDDGHAWVSIESVRQDGAFLAVVRVRDDGIGIDAAMLPRVFDMFAQADTSLARTQGGLGIGLTLVRNLVESHLGTVEAASRGLTQGSEFTVRLPRAEHDESALGARVAAAGAPARPAARRILVVDDNRDAAECMAMVLRLDGHEVTSVHDGISALAAAQSVAPAAILLDIGLPGIDGYEVARRLRQQPPTAETLLIAVSGYGQEDDRRRSKEAGFDHHLTKPVDFLMLEGMLRQGSAERPAVVAQPVP